MPPGKVCQHDDYHLSSLIELGVGIEGSFDLDGTTCSLVDYARVN